jgi:hypothetical protein
MSDIAVSTARDRVIDPAALKRLSRRSDLQDWRAGANVLCFFFFFFYSLLSSPRLLSPSLRISLSSYYTKDTHWGVLYWYHCRGVPQPCIQLG